MKTNKQNDEYFVIFGGGGIRGLCYCGAYKALQENNINITGYAGSSIGAVFACLAAFGYNFDEIYEMLSETGFGIFCDINVNFKKEIAFSKGEIFLNWMREKIEQKFYGDKYKKGKIPPVKFCDIKEKLIIYSVDLINMKFKEFSNTETPDFEIALAIRASVSMPGLFTPLEIDDSLLVDGDLIKSTPLWRVTNSIKNLNEKIIEFRLEDNETPKKITNSLEYINRVYNAICGFATDYIIDLYKEKDKFEYIKINTPDVSVIDFLIPKEKKKELFDIGYKTTNEYFKNFYPQKRKKIALKYQNLLKYILKFQKEFAKKNIINANLYLYEIFVYLCEEKRYLDMKLYEKICCFKNSFQNNYLSYNFLCFHGANLKNKEDLNKELLDIIKEVSAKI